MLPLSTVPSANRLTTQNKRENSLDDHVYLAEKYGKNDGLVKERPRNRGVVSPCFYIIESLMESRGKTVQTRHEGGSQKVEHVVDASHSSIARICYFLNVGALMLKAGTP